MKQIYIFLIFLLYTTCLYSMRVKVFSTNISAETVIFTKSIVHTPYSKICILGDDLYITGQVTGADKLYLYYRSTGQINYKKMRLSLHNSTKQDFLFKVPNSFISLSGLDYFLKATNAFHHSVFYKYSETVPYHLEVTQNNTAEIGINGGIISLIDGNPFDGESMLEIKSKSLDKNFTVTIQQLDVSSVPEGNTLTRSRRPVAAYSFSPDGMVLARSAKLSLLYFDLNNDGIVESATGKKTGIRETDLKVFGWDGLDWIYLGGENNKIKNTVSVKINQLFIYALFPAEKIRPDDIRPKEKICTPNGDGINDYVHFSGLTEPFRIDIFNLSGKKIRSITDNSLWDGKDEEGVPAEAGPYLYQVETAIENKKQLISGIIVIAR